MSCMFNEVCACPVVETGERGTARDFDNLSIGIARAARRPTDRTFWVAFRWVVLWICRAADSLNSSRIVKDVMSLSALQLGSSLECQDAAERRLRRTAVAGGGHQRI